MCWRNKVIHESTPSHCSTNLEHFPMLSSLSYCRLLETLRLVLCFHVLTLSWTLWLLFSLLNEVISFRQVCIRWSMPDSFICVCVCVLAYFLFTQTPVITLSSGLIFSTALSTSTEQHLIQANVMYTQTAVFNLLNSRGVNWLHFAILV